MRRAFTMLELVFVIVVVGILSAMIAPNFQRNSIREAADQVISHIRYTQHLAMMDDKYDPSDSRWFKHRWQIRFVKDINNGTTNCNGVSNLNIWTYMIYANNNFVCPGGICDNNPNINEFAKNPLDNNKLLTGGYSKLVCADNTYNNPNSQSTKSMRLAEKYGVTNVTFSGGCRSDVKYINFDSLGRPSNAFPKSLPYQIPVPGRHNLLTTACNITLTDGTNSITITIEPETGYAHIL